MRNFEHFLFPFLMIYDDLVVGALAFDIGT